MEKYPEMLYKDGIVSSDATHQVIVKNDEEKAEQETKGFSSATPTPPENKIVTDPEKRTSPEKEAPHEKGTTGTGNALLGTRTKTEHDTKR